MKVFKKLIAAAVVFCLTFTIFATSAVFAASAPAQEFDLSTATATLHGKYFTKSQGYAFSYGSAGFSVNFTGSEFWIYVPETPMQDATTVRQVGIAVLVDTDMPLEAEIVSINKSGWIQLASGLSAGEHKITVRKQSRGFYGIMASDWFNVSKIGLASGGEVKTPDPLSDLVVEVYGDSISNGDAVWLNADGSNSSYTYGNYTGVIERLLDAEVKVCANTGNGLLGWVMSDDDKFAEGEEPTPENLLPPQNCWNVIDSQAANQPYSHEGANAADVVIINLGTNDRRELGFGDMTLDQFHDEYLRFIKQIKTDCPDAIVIGTLGAMGGISEFGETIQRVVVDANEWNGETFCYFFELQQCGSIQGGLGYDNGHPSNLAHEIYGLQLSTLINKALKLNKTLPTDIPEEAYAAKININDPSKTGTVSDNGIDVYGGNHTADLIADGNTSTGWQPSSKDKMGDDCWVQVVFSEKWSCTAVELCWEKDTRPNTDGKGFKVQYTEDGTTWKDISGATYTYGEAKEGEGNVTDTVTFSELKSKGFRVITYDNATTGAKSYATKLYEIAVTSKGGAVPEGNLMDLVTGKTDNMARVEAAFKLENITVQTDGGDVPDVPSDVTSGDVSGDVSSSPAEEGGSDALVIVPIAVAVAIVAVVILLVVVVILLVVVRGKKKA